MMIDYLTLLLINMAAGFVLLAGYLFFGMDEERPYRWVGGFAITGAVAAVFGTHMALTWPLMGAFNIAYGETSVLFGVILLGAALVLAKGWDLLSVAIYAAFAGLASIVLGLRLFTLGIPQHPEVVMVGFVLSGLCGILAAPTLLWCKKNRVVRILGTLALLGAATIWALIGYMSYWMHVDGFKSYKPAFMRAPAISAPPVQHK